MGRVDNRVWTGKEWIVVDFDDFYGRDDSIRRVEYNQFQDDEQHNDRYVSFLQTVVIQRVPPHVDLGDLHVPDDLRVEQDEYNERKNENDDVVEDVEISDIERNVVAERRQLLPWDRHVVFEAIDDVILEEARDHEANGQDNYERHLELSLSQRQHVLGGKWLADGDVSIDGQKNGHPDRNALRYHTKGIDVLLHVRYDHLKSGTGARYLERSQNGGEYEDTDDQQGAVGYGQCLQQKGRNPVLLIAAEYNEGYDVADQSDQTDRSNDD